MDPGHSKERLEFAVSQACRHEAHAVILGLIPVAVRFVFSFTELSSSERPWILSRGCVDSMGSAHTYLPADKSRVSVV